MDGVVSLLVLALPAMIVCLLLGLGLSVAVLVTEGRGRSFAASRILGIVNVGWVGPLVLLGVSADARDVRLMFLFAAAVFALIGVMGLRLALRARDEAGPGSTP